jgi:ATP/maltotriose-dependent transcriptional regulator MalT
VEDPRSALELHRAALETFERAGDQRGVAETLDLLGMAAYLGADIEACARFYGRAVHLFRELDDRPRLVLSQAMLGVRAGVIERGSAFADAAAIQAALRDGQAAIDLARAIDWPAGEAFALAMRACVLPMAGAYAEALAQASRGLALAHEIEHRQWIVFARTALAAIHLDLLDPSAAIDHLDPALHLAGDVNSAFWTRLCTGALAVAYCMRGEPGRAGALLGDAPAFGQPVTSLGEWWLNYGHAHLALARRDYRMALSLAERATPPALEGERTAETARPALLRAHAHFKLGELDRSEAALHYVEALCHRQSDQPTLWRCYALLGQVLRAQGRVDAAKQPFGEARLLIEELATELENETRDAFLRHATQRLPRGYRLSAKTTEAVRHGGLSAREREVAALIGRGLSNREISEQLVLGERTIETHVSSILSKLGITSRREVSALIGNGDDQSHSPMRT